jgi:hypothetical protein
MTTGMPLLCACAISLLSTFGWGDEVAMPVAFAAMAAVKASSWRATSLLVNTLRTVTPRSFPASAAPLFAIAQIWSVALPCEIQ